MQTFKKILLAAAVATIASAQLFAASPRRGFAVVIDARSYEEARRQVDDYAAEIGKSGLEVHFVIDRTGQPDSLRQVLRQLWKQPKAPIEGAVLIGDIPVVMVRDAQHLTSAFKMDQTAFGSRRSPPTGSTTISASNSPRWDATASIPDVSTIR